MNAHTETKAPLSLGYLAGLTKQESSHHSSISNPFDRRTKQGKDWDRGYKVGVNRRCFNGQEWADEEISAITRGDRIP